MPKPFTTDFPQWMRQQEDNVTGLTRRGIGGKANQEINIYPRLVGWNFDPALASAAVAPEVGKAVLHRFTTNKADDIASLQFHITSPGAGAMVLHFSVFDVTGLLLGHASTADVTTINTRTAAFDAPFPIGAGTEVWVVIQAIGSGTPPTLTSAPGSLAMNVGLTSASPFRVGSYITGALVTSVTPTNYSAPVGNPRPFMALQTAP